LYVTNSGSQSQYDIAFQIAEPAGSAWRHLQANTSTVISLLNRSAETTKTEALPPAGKCIHTIRLLSWFLLKQQKQRSCRYIDPLLLLLQAQRGST
jgi:hypothetical protein